MCCQSKDLTEFLLLCCQVKTALSLQPQREPAVKFQTCTHCIIFMLLGSFRCACPPLEGISCRQFQKKQVPLRLVPFLRSTLTRHYLSSDLRNVSCSSTCSVLRNSLSESKNILLSSGGGAEGSLPSELGTPANKLSAKDKIQQGKQKLYSEPQSRNS